MRQDDAPDKGEAESGPSRGELTGVVDAEKRFEDLFLHRVRDTAAVVSDADSDAPRRVEHMDFHIAFGRRILQRVANQVIERPTDKCLISMAQVARFAENENS